MTHLEALDNLRLFRSP